MMRGLTDATERVLPQLAGRILSVPIVTAFVALGAVVLVGRSLKGVWTLLRPEHREQHIVTMPLGTRERHAA